MKKTSIFMFLVSLALGIYSFKSQVSKNESAQKVYTEQNLVPKGPLPERESKTELSVQQNEKARIEIIKDEKTGEENFQIFIPKGKRLYNEEKMNAIATSANLELSYSER